jgi:hypothetical protein
MRRTALYVPLLCVVQLAALMPNPRRLAGYHALGSHDSWNAGGVFSSWMKEAGDAVTRAPTAQPTLRPSSAPTAGSSAPTATAVEVISSLSAGGASAPSTAPIAAPSAAPSHAIPTPITSKRVPTPALPSLPFCRKWMQQTCSATTPCTGFNSTRMWSKDCGICKFKHCALKDVRMMLAVTPCSFRCKATKNKVPAPANSMNVTASQSTATHGKQSRGRGGGRAGVR